MHLVRLFKLGNVICFLLTFEHISDEGWHVIYK